MIETRFHSDGHTDEFAITRHQRIDPFLDYAKERVATGDTGTSDMKVAAEFPDVVVENYLATTGITFREFLGNPEHVKRMLNDPALKGFRIWQGNA